MSISTSRYPLCRHTKTNGRPCQSPALAASAFCYHHRKLRRTHMSTIDVPALSTRVLHPLRDAGSIQHALAMVFSGLISGRLGTAQAGKMLFALQTAILHLKTPSK